MALIGSLVVNVSADAEPFERGMKKAQSASKSALGSIRKEMKSFNRDMKTLMVLEGMGKGGFDTVINAGLASMGPFGFALAAVNKQFELTGKLSEAAFGKDLSGHSANLKETEDLGKRVQETQDKRAQTYAQLTDKAAAELVTVQKGWEAGRRVELTSQGILGKYQERVIAMEKEVKAAQDNAKAQEAMANVLKGLEFNRRTAGLEGVALQVEQIREKLGGLSPEMEAFIRRQAEMAEAGRKDAEAWKGLRELNASLDRAIALFGKTADEAAKLDLIAKGIPEHALKDVEAKQKQLQAMKDQAAEAEKIKNLLEGIKTPELKFQEKFNDLADLFNRGKINKDQFQKLAEKDAAPFRQEPKLPQALLKDSAAAISAINQENAGGGQNKIEEMVKQQIEQVIQAKKMVDLLQKLADIDKNKDQPPPNKL